MDDHDEAPELPGRERLVAELDEALRQGRHPAVVVVSLQDLDGLRDEDAAAAEVAVTSTATRLLRLVRSSDVVATDGDGTFLVAGAGVGDADVDVLVDRIEGAVAFPCDAGGRMLSLVADVGWATSTEGRSGRELVAAAEARVGQQRR